MSDPWLRTTNAGTLPILSHQRDTCVRSVAQEQGAEASDLI